MVNEEPESRRNIKIFVASSAEMEAERGEMVHIVNEVGKVFPHLKLEPVKWETDLESGSYQKQRIQDEINPLLAECDIVVVLFYSRVGRFTLEEYGLAIEKDKKVFLYFKTGFSPRASEEHRIYGRVLQLKERVAEDNRTLYREYQIIEEFRRLLYQDLNLYLSNHFPAARKKQIPRLLTKMPPKTVDLVGRGDALAAVEEIMAGSDRVLLVNGLGGVGKTELCKRYFWDRVNRFQHLAWVDVVGSIKESLVTQLNLEGIGLDEKDSLEDQFQKIMAFLRHLPANSLLVLDNLEDEDDPDLETVFGLSLKVMASSRLRLKGFNRYDLDFLSPTACKELFYHFYEGGKPFLACPSR
jgi:nucleoside 2-deoxyribosyltransferase